MIDGMRFKFFFTVLFLSVTVFHSYGQKKQICFTFDDLPMVSYGINDTIFQEGLFDNLIGSLKSNEIPAIGFVNEQKLY